MTEEKQDPQFEDLLQELEGVVERLEAGSLPLEGSLAAFEKGVGLVRRLSGTLDEAERRVEVLLKENGDQKLDFREIADDQEP